jgi:transglutaminase-like putative cysteine protease
MKNQQCCARYRSKLLAGALGAALLAWAPAARAGAPDWLRALARTPVPEYPKDTNAVLLLSEQTTTVKDKGEIVTYYRYAFKILRPQGRGKGAVVVPFDSETRLTYFKAWSITAEAQEYEVKEKEAIETSPFTESLYDDMRLKILRIPASEPGNVIGYEFEQKRRPYVYQDLWRFQSDVPARQARFTLELPKGWEFEPVWLHHGAQQAQPAGENRWVWQLDNVPAVESESASPAWQALAGRLAVTYFPRTEEARSKSHASWGDVGQWYAKLASSSLQSTPEIRRKVAELTAGAATALEKIHALAVFVQREVRYVAIEVGIGGYQPHAAREVFAQRYGDCKDKVTLLRTMLREAGVESYYVLVHTSRGAAAAEFPSMLNFNHVILAIRLPKESSSGGLFAVSQHTTLGGLLFFDPTDPHTRFSYLPASLQASNGLLVTENGGELVRLPLLAPATNRLLRTAKLRLSPGGMLSGQVQELRWGLPAVSRREQLLAAQPGERAKVLERFLGASLSNFVMAGAEVENLDDFEKNLILHYRFVADNYAKFAGSLLLFRPRVIGRKGDDLLEKKERKNPIEFAATTLESDDFEITLPAGYTVDDLPPPVEQDLGFASYKSKFEVKESVLHYSRIYQVKEVWIPPDRVEEVNKLFRAIAADERASAILKRTEP